MTKEPIRDREHLHARMSSWLNNVRMSTGGWAEITEDDVDELWYLVDGLIHLKCDSDPDGDVPIDFLLVDRTKNERMCFRPVPYGNDEDTEEERFHIIEKNWFNAHHAIDKLDDAMKEYKFHRNEKATE
jgi:hypothetical protein